MHATITNNSVDLTDAGAFEALYVGSGASSTDTTRVCADIKGNSLATAGAGFAEVRLRQRFAGTSFNLPGYTGGALTMTQVQDFVRTNNGGSPVVAADATGPGYTNTPSCTAAAG